MAIVIEFSSCCFILFISTLCLSVQFSNEKNVDTKFPIVFQMTKQTSDNVQHMFGHSVLMYDSDNHAGPIYLIGAPNYYETVGDQFDRLNTGAVFYCQELPISLPLSSQHNLICTNMNLTKKFQSIQPDLFTSDMHIGWNLISRSKSEQFVSCAFSYTIKMGLKNQQQKFETWQMPNGACFMTSLLPSSLSSSSSSLNNEKNKVFFPMSNLDEQFVLNGQYLYAYGMAGISAMFNHNQDTLFMGAPGFDNWKGAISNVNLSQIYSFKTVNRPFKITTYNQSDPGDYLGYSMSIGNYFHKHEQMAIGAPRSNLAGSVVVIGNVPIDNSLIYQPDFKRIQTEDALVLRGYQAGEYFGYSLLTIDGNSDGFDDLLVSAPMYSSMQMHSSDEGRVFVFISNRLNGFHESKILLGDSKSFGRFGTAMENLGDLNKDGYPDIAIGAPYEDDYRGSVYIYNGNMKGFPERYSQRISSKKDFPSLDLRGFGYSFSSNVDVDNNDFNDLLVGSYLSDKAVLLRSRPIIKVQPSIQMNKDYIDLDTPCEFNNKDDDDNGMIIENIISNQSACIRLKYCFEISSEFHSIHSHSHDNSLILDTSLKLDPQFNRAFVPVGDARYIDEQGRSLRFKLTNQLSQQFVLLLQGNKNYCSDYYVVKFKHFKNIVNFLDPVVFILDYSIQPLNNLDKNLEDHLFQLPLLENEQTNITTELYFKMCGKMVKNCISKLLTSMVVYLDDQPSTISNQPAIVQIVEGQYRLITISVQLKNFMKPAFHPKMIIQTEYPVQLVQLDEKCQFEASGNNKTFICSLENPLLTDDMVNLTFKSFEIHNNQTKVTFDLTTTIYNEFHHSSIVDYNVLFEITKQAHLETKIIKPDNKLMVQRLKDESFKEQKPYEFKSTIQLDHYGPSSIESIELDFIYPNSHDNYEFVTDIQLNLSDKTIPMRCRSLYDYNPPSTKKTKPVFYSLDSQTRIVNLNCANDKVICKIRRCNIDRLEIVLPVNNRHLSTLFLYQKAKMKLKNVQEKFSYFNNLTFQVDLSVKVYDKHLKMDAFSDGFQYNLIPVIPKKENLLCYLILAVIIAFFIFALIIIVLYRCGFFKRLKKDDYPSEENPW